MLLIVIICFQILHTVLLFKLLRSGSFVQVREQHVYIPQKKATKPKKVQQLDDEEDY